MINIIKKYYELNTQYKEIKNEKDKLSGNIKDWMVNDLDENYIIVDEYALRIQLTDKSKYDTDKLINYLKYIGANDVIETKEVINMKKLKNIIDSGELDKKDIEHLRTKDIRKALYVSKASLLKDKGKYNIL